jgi:ribosomal protein S17
MVTRTGIDKFVALTGAFAVKIAREKQDPLYAKLLRFKKAYRVVKKQIMSKYGTKAKMAARAAASK